MKTSKEDGFIDLGKPSKLMESKPAEPTKDRVYYPSTYITSEKPIKLPEEGEAVIRFRKKSSSENTDEDGKTSYSCSIDILGIKPVNNGGDTMKGLSAALDERAAKKASDYEKD